VIIMDKTIFYSVSFMKLGSESFDLPFKKVGISTNFGKRLNDYQTWGNKHKLQMVVKVDECFAFETKGEALDFEKEILNSVDIFQAEGFDFPNPNECIDVDVEIMMPSNAIGLDENLEYEGEYE